MSKLSIIEEDPPKDWQKECAFRLKRKRKPPLHPSEINKRLADKAKRGIPEKAWKYPNGFLIKLIGFDRVVRYRQTARNATYDDAVYYRDFELDSGKYMEAWIIQREPKIGGFSNDV
jgi:hypothetical protein